MKTKNIIQLSDGNKLCYAEYGNPKGEPVFLFHGNPGSRLSWGLFPDSPFLSDIRIIVYIFKPIGTNLGIKLRDTS